MIPICLATEDPLTMAVAEKLLSLSPQDFYVEQRFCRGGFGYLQKNINAFNNIARHTTPVLLLTDLDNKPCASLLIDSWRGGKPLAPNLLFRVVVRAIEAWLLADTDGFAIFAAINSRQMPREPERLPDPKQALLNLVRRSRNRQLKNALLPEPGAVAKVGLEYNTVLGEFVRTHWNPEQAACMAPSLQRAITRINQLTP